MWLVPQQLHALCRMPTIRKDADIKSQIEAIFQAVFPLLPKHPVRQSQDVRSRCCAETCLWMALRRATPTRTSASPCRTSKTCQRTRSVTFPRGRYVACIVWVCLAHPLHVPPARKAVRPPSKRHRLRKRQARLRVVAAAAKPRQHQNRVRSLSWALRSTTTARIFSTTRIRTSVIGK